MNAKSEIQQSPVTSGGIPPLIIIIVIVLILGGLGYILFKDKIAALVGGNAPAGNNNGSPAKGAATATDMDANGQAINSGGYLIDADGHLKTDSDGNPILGAGVAGDDTPETPSVVDTIVQSLSGDTNPAFPLVQVYGSSLHVSNPYVKDVQQYLNKFGGAKLDIDGAFGTETEAAVLKTLGTTTVTKEQYNSTIAPPLGKPAV